jgi:hypothetical protein
MNGLKTMALWCRCRWGENCRESIVSCECPEEAPYGLAKNTDECQSGDITYV